MKIDRRLLAACWLCCVCLLRPGPAMAQTSSLVSPTLARQYGLERAWFKQVELDRARHRIAHLALHVSSADTETIYELHYEGGREAFSERDLDRFGQMVGKEQAKKLADLRLQALQTAKRNPELKTVVRPDVLLLITTTGGLLQAVDGESGRTRWSVQLGDSRFITEAPAANDRYVAAVSGTTSYLMNRSDGKMLWEYKIRGAPAAGPAVSDLFVYVPTVTGNVEYVPVEDPRKSTYVYQSIGRTLLPPVTSNTSVAWTTDRGYMYVGSKTETGPRFRVETGDAITAAPTPISGQRMLLVSVDGYVYCIHEHRQNVIWRFSTGQPISTPPVAMGEYAYVLTDDGNLFKLGLDTGAEEWYTGGVRALLAAGQERLFTVNVTGRIENLNARQEGRMSIVPVLVDALIYTNSQTDRIYIGSRTGLVQCLHATDLEHPVIHKTLEEKPAAEAPQTGPKPAAEAAPAAPARPAPADPFGVGDDPFAPRAAPAAPAAPGADPFGAPGGAPAADDPFAPRPAAPAAPAGDDPFAPP